MKKEENKTTKSERKTGFPISKILLYGAGIGVGIALIVVSIWFLTRKPKEQEASAGYQVVESSDDRFVLVVVNSEHPVEVRMKTTSKNPKKEDYVQEQEVVSLGEENTFGIVVQEEGYYEIEVVSGKRSQSKVIHVEDNQVYSVIFDFKM